MEVDDLEKRCTTPIRSTVLSAEMLCAIGRFFFWFHACLCFSFSLQIRGPYPSNVTVPTETTVKLMCELDTTSKPTFASFAWNIGNDVQNMCNDTICISTLTLFVTSEYLSGVLIQCSFTAQNIDRIFGANATLVAYG